MKGIRWLTAAYSVFLIGIVLIADLGIGDRLRDVMDGLPGGDKTGHFLLMGMLSFLLNLSLAADRMKIVPLRPLKGSLPKGSLIAAGVVFLDEFSQLFLSAREFSPFDLAADIVGVVLFGELAAWLMRWHQSRRARATHSPRYSGKSGGIGGGTA